MAYSRSELQANDRHRKSRRVCVGGQICSLLCTSGARKLLLLSQNNAAVDLALAPVHPSGRKLVTGLERPDVLLAVAGGLGVQGPDNLCAVSPVAGPMGEPGVLAAEAAG
jgi:hypothetical protein